MGKLILLPFPLRERWQGLCSSHCLNSSIKVPWSKPVDPKVIWGNTLGDMFMDSATKIKKDEDQCAYCTQPPHPTSLPTNKQTTTQNKTKTKPQTKPNNPAGNLFTSSVVRVFFVLWCWFVFFCLLDFSTHLLHCCIHSFKVSGWEHCSGCMLLFVTCWAVQSLSGVWCAGCLCRKSPSTFCIIQWKLFQQTSLLQCKSNSNSR